MQVEEQWVGKVLLDRYRIVDQIDAGGVAAVFRAEQAELSREVAVKILAENVEGATHMRARFEREARALAALSHPHTVPLLDFGVAEGRPFLVMELLRGRSLEDALASESFDPKRSLAIVRQVLHALSFAHGQGVVHRDIKPGNIFLEQLPHTNDHVRVLDFGFAKFFASDDDRQGDVATMAGTTFGTPAYIAPEQLGETELDGRADLYAVGVILFQMLAGKRPFEGTPAEMLRGKLTREAPALAEVREDLQVVPALNEILRRVLQRDPGERFATAQQMLEAMSQLPDAAVSGEGGAPVASQGVEHTQEVTVGMLVGPLEQAGTPSPPDAAKTEPESAHAARTEPESPQDAKTQLDPMLDVPPPPDATAEPSPEAPAPLPESPVASPGLRPDAPPSPTAPPSTSDGSPPWAEWAAEAAERVARWARRAGRFTVERMRWLGELLADWSRRTGVPRWALIGGPALVLVCLFVGLALVLGDSESDSSALKLSDAVPFAPAEPTLWQEPLPEPLAAAHTHVMDGEALDDQALLELRRYGNEHPESPHPWLLIGHTYTERHWYSDALESYERAYRADPIARNDPFVAGNLITMLTQPSVANEALELARELYDEELGDLIDARLEDDSLRPVHAQRLQRVRDRL